MTSDYQVDALGITVFFDMMLLVFGIILFSDACYDLCLGVAPLSRFGAFSRKIQVNYYHASVDKYSGGTYT